MNKILMIDDDQNLTKLVQNHLNKLGYSVLTANSSETGLNAAKENYPDLILLDIMMPGINGVDAVKMIKSIPIVRDIPIIFLTGLVTPNKNNQDEEKILVDNTYYESIGKPFEMSDLLEKIEANLTER